MPEDGCLSVLRCLLTSNDDKRWDVVLRRLVASHDRRCEVMAVVLALLEHNEGAKRAVEAVLGHHRRVRVRGERV